MNPLATTDTTLTALKSALEAKTSEAQGKWAVFEDARTKAVESGADLTKDRATVRRLDGLHGEYEEVAKECESLRESLFRAIDGKTRASGEDSGISGLGAEFLRKLGAGHMGLKALDGTSGGSMVGPFFDERIRVLPQRSLFVRSLIPVTPIDSDKAWWLRHSVADHQAEPVAPGALKPTSTYTVERVEQPVVTIAHVSEALDRALLSDFDALVTFIDGQLRLGVLLAEENQIVNGDGVGVNLTGILNTSGIQVQAVGGDSRADAIFKAITKVRTAFLEPDGVVLNPNDYALIRLSKNAEDNYLVADVTSADGERLFGKPVITSPVIAEGTGIVGAFGVGARLWDREEARVTFSEQGANDAGDEMFVRNEVRFRGEERIAFGVERPAAFVKVTGL